MEERHDGADSSPEFSSDHHHRLRSELESLRSKSSAMEEILALLRGERDEAVARNAELSRAAAEILRENESLSRRVDNLEALTRDKEDEFCVKMEGLRIEAEIYRERIGETEGVREKSEKILAAYLDSVKSAKESLVMIIDDIADEPICVSDGVRANSSEGSELSEELNAFSRLVLEVKEKVGSYRESRKKEKKELENSVTSLTEENRDINSLLRVALLEKESVEKRLKGNAEQKSRVAILQRVGLGFGFMTAIGNSESSDNKSHGSESEVEVVSLASTVERIMKNLRLEITQLRRSLEESRSDAERLQSLTEKQAQDIAENLMYIKELENRDRILTQNVEELLTTVRETEAEVERWREACELEVEAANVEIGERDKLVAILKQELDRTKASLEISNGKLELKNELAAAAMAAQAAAEKSLKLADSRVGALRARIEDLSKQLEESEKREQSSLKIRHRLCWPWRALRPNYTTNNNVRSRLLPEMQALLRHNV